MFRTSLDFLGLFFRIKAGLIPSNLLEGYSPYRLLSVRGITISAIESMIYCLAFATRSRIDSGRSVRLDLRTPDMRLQRVGPARKIWNGESR